MDEDDKDIYRVIIGLIVIVALAVAFGEVILEHSWRAIWGMTGP